jgi:putative tricarboxylic transport membrane protein
MKRADRIFAFICLGLSCWLILESFRYDYMTYYTPGPGFHPFWLGVCLSVLSLFLLFDTFRRKDSKKEDKETKLPGGNVLLRAGMILLITAGLAFFMMKIGFVVATFAFIAVILITLEKYSIFKGILYGAILSGAIFLIFRYWLNVDLPRGWLGL